MTQYDPRLVLDNIHWRYHITLTPDSYVDGEEYDDYATLGSYSTAYEAMDTMRYWCRVLRPPARFHVRAQQWGWTRPDKYLSRDLMPASSVRLYLASYTLSRDGGLVLGTIVENDAVTAGWLEPLPG